MLASGLIDLSPTSRRLPRWMLGRRTTAQFLGILILSLAGFALSGTVVEVNESLVDKPETINEDAYGDGWLFVMEIDDAEQLNELLAPDDYAELLEDEDH